MKVIRAFDPDQHRDRDGKWTTFSSTMDMEKYAKYYDVYDETTTRSGLTVVTQTNGDMQIAWDDPENSEQRHVLLDIEVDDIERVRDVLDEVLESDEQGDWELADDGEDQIWASFTLDEETVNVYIPLSDDDEDVFEMDIDLDEARELRDALNRQIERYNELEDEEPSGAVAGDVDRARSPENGESAPAGGQFAPGGGRVGGKGKRTKPRRRAPKKPPAPAGPLSFDGKTGSGYGIKGGDPRVRTLQAALTRLGITDSAGNELAPDGKYGPKTTSAVKKLQKALGLEADGKVTPELLKQITDMKQVPPSTKPRAPRKRSKSARRAASPHEHVLDNGICTTCDVTRSTHEHVFDNGICQTCP